MGRERSFEGRSAGPGNAGGASRGTAGGSGRTMGNVVGDIAAFGLQGGKITKDVVGRAFTNTLNGKTTASGEKRQVKPGEDLVSDALANPVALNDVQKAVLESRRQRNLQNPGLDAAQTILGAMPAPGLAGAFGLGRWMGKAAEDEALANPSRFTTIPGDPGAIKSTSGPLTANRALPGNSPKDSDATGTKGTLGEDPFEDRRKKKSSSGPTLLGSNPVDILGAGIQRIS